MKAPRIAVLAAVKEFKPLCDSLKAGDEVRLKTFARPICEFLTGTNVQTASHAGEDVKSSWVSKISSNQAAKFEGKPLPGEDLETAVADDEWDD